ncbi:hypothetical protein SISSUDRAFT_1123246 [Sistotremastrum suecicum HHB10207 ss-3]|uniref:Uncharacterized protein n=1 Tax=Sistotremastrum suecicum HHB10207 ss-3 TaxID=1314776 RepID=A0A165Y163_9AGAM|nr:hypothetical protein SISSUDRAFT_1123246 [Sistotremastrum suecicum HHB10207 ss-3]
MAQLSGMLWKIAGSPFIHTFKLHYSAFPQTLHDFPLASFVEGSLPRNSSSLRNITIRVHKHFPEWHSLSCLNRFLLRHDGIINAEIRFYTQSNVEYGARTHYASLNGIPNTVPNLKTFTGDLLTAKALQSQQSLQSIRLECPPLRHGLDISCEFWKVIDAPFPGVRTLEMTRAIRPSFDSGLLFEIDRCFPNLVTLRGLRLSESMIMSETENPLESESSQGVCGYAYEDQGSAYAGGASFDLPTSLNPLNPCFRRSGTRAEVLPNAEELAEALRAVSQTIASHR